MDHGGQCEREGPEMSQGQGGGVNLCQPDADLLTDENESLSLHPMRTLSPAHTDTPTDTHSPPSPLGQDSFNNNEEEEEERREGLGRQQGEEDEGEENDEVMKSESDESSLVRSPDTPMTDSSETGSLLETPYPNSPEPEVNSHISDTGSVACTTGPSTSIIGPTCVTGSMTCSTQDPASVSRTAASLPTSTTEPVRAATEPITSHLHTTVTCTTGPQNPTTEPMTSITCPTCTTGPMSAVITDPVTSVSGPVTSVSGPVTSGSGPVTSGSGPVTSGSGPVTFPPGSALLASLQHLSQRGDDTHLPQYLHQIAEAFVLQEDYQRALWCIQLERLYHQRILQNLTTLQEHWESHSRTSVSDLDTQQLDTLSHICQTHQRPSTRDTETECVSLDSLLRPERLADPSSPCTPGHRGMNEQTEAADSALTRGDQRIASSALLTDGSCSNDSTDGLKRQGGFYGKHPTDREEKCSEQTITPNPSAWGGVGRSETTQLQGGETARKEEVEEPEREVLEEAEEALEMEEEEEEEGEEEEKKKKKKEKKRVCLKALPEEILVTEAEMVKHLHQEAGEELHQEAQEQLHQEAQVSEEGQAHQQQELCFEEEEYGVERLDIIRESATLDDLAKRITVEEISPPSGLVSILKRRRACVDDVCPSPGTEPKHTLPPAKRRVRFKVADEGFDHEVGGGDSCLLLFLLCLVTVVISVGGTALYCALGDAHSSVCQDFSRNADFYLAQVQRGVAQLQHWFAPGS